jgi:ligand-binding SRPBCC domain-containing protein
MPSLYTSEQWLPFPLELVFAFFANPENLPRLMPPWQQARIDRSSITAPPPHPDPASRINSPAAGAGTRLTLTFRLLPLLPVRLAWDAEISDFVWNDHFCDIQLKRGPFAFWRHCHTLRREARDNNSGTLLHDEVRYIAPFGPLGTLAGPFLTMQLDHMFAYRHTQTAKLLPQFAANLD